MCQKNSGGPYQATLRFAVSSLSFTTGEPKYYRSSTFGRRGFWAGCGSPIAFVYEGQPHVWILLGTLDHPEDWPMTRDAAWGPIEHFYVETKVPWLNIDDGLPQKRSDQ
jgi:hypothetical protein